MSKDSNLDYCRRVRSPSLQFLKTFLIVAKRGSFKAAAENLCVTSAAVSQQIKLLEQQLGLILFERKPNSLELTEAGSHYQDSINSLFSRIDLATEQVRRRYRRALVRLQVPSLFFTELLLPRLPEFTAAHPEIDFQLSTTVSLAEHPVDADVSIAVGRGIWKNLDATRLFAQTFVLAGQPGLLLRESIEANADIGDQVLLGHRSRPDLWDQWAAACGIGELPTRQLIRFDSLSAVVHAAERGVGIALVSAPVSAGRFAAGTLCRVGTDELETGDSYFVVARQHDTIRREVEMVVEWLSRRFGPALASSARAALPSRHEARSASSATTS